MELNRDVVDNIILSLDHSSKGGTKNKKDSKVAQSGKDKTKSTVLDFRDQQIESLGQFSSYMNISSTFKVWDLSQNYIQEIPEDLSPNSRFEEILLSENVLSTMIGFNNNMYLRSLNLSNNNIKRIEGIDNLPELRSLVCSPSSYRTYLETQLHALKTSTSLCLSLWISATTKSHLSKM